MKNVNILGGGGGLWKNLSLRGVTNNQYIGRRCLKGGGAVFKAWG